MRSETTTTTRYCSWGIMLGSKIGHVDNKYMVKLAKIPSEPVLGILSFTTMSAINIGNNVQAP